MLDYLAVEKAAAQSPKIPKVFVQLDGEFKSLLTEYGLWLKKNGLDIGPPDVEGEQEYPPGYDMVLDFTQAVDGKVHFKKRAISIELVCLRPKAQWESIRSQLETALQGQWLKFYVSRDPDKAYQGQFEVELTPGDYTATVKISVTGAP